MSDEMKKVEKDVFEQKINEKELEDVAGGKIISGKCSTNVNAAVSGRAKNRSYCYMGGQIVKFD